MEIEILGIKKPVEQKDEMFGFEFEGNNVSFRWKQLEPAIASWIFLLYNEIKEKENQRAEASRLRNYYRKELTRQSNHIKGRKEQVTWMLRKIENYDIQNRALIEYCKVLKKKALETESKAK